MGKLVFSALAIRRHDAFFFCNPSIASLGYWVGWLWLFVGWSAAPGVPFGSFCAFHLALFLPSCLLFFCPSPSSLSDGRFYFPFTSK
jgi:hypothetical protein